MSIAGKQIEEVDKFTYLGSIANNKGDIDADIQARIQDTWRRTRMAELEERWLTWREAKRAAQNRVRWRALVDDLCSNINEED